MDKAPFLVINLATSTQRWQTLSEQLKNSDVQNWRRIDAFLGKEIEKKPERKMIEPKVLSEAKKPYRKNHYNHNLGSIGCYISHMKAWEEGMRSSSEFVIICEDDIVIPKDLGTRMKQLLDNVPRDWQVLVMGDYTLQEKHSYYVEVNQNYYIVPTKWTCMNLYAIKKSACRYLLGKAVPIRKQLDWFVSDHSSAIKVYIAIDPATELNKTLSNNSDIRHTAVKS